MSACEKGGQWQGVAPLPAQMHMRGLSLDVISFSAAMSACEKGGQRQRVAPLLDERCGRVFLHVINLNAATSACGRGVQWQHVARLLDEMHI
eukprot:3850330-Karenia_brevis.AAC.1